MTPPRQRPICGSRKGYARHTAANETPCDPCAMAAREYARSYRAQTPEYMARNASKNSARTRAKTRLAREYPARFLEIFEEELAK